MSCSNDPGRRGLEARFQETDPVSSALEDEDVRQLDLELDPPVSSRAEMAELERLRARALALEPYFETRRELANSLMGRVRHPELPGFLEHAVGLHPDVTLGLLESRDVGTPCLRASNLTVHVERGIVRAWGSSVAVSIEPTATSGTWLVFASWS